MNTNFVSFPWRGAVATDFSHSYSLHTLICNTNQHVNRNFIPSAIAIAIAIDIDIDTASMLIFKKFSKTFFFHKRNYLNYPINDKRKNISFQKTTKLSFYMKMDHHHLLDVGLSFHSSDGSTLNQGHPIVRQFQIVGPSSRRSAFAWSLEVSTFVTSVDDSGCHETAISDVLFY